MTTDTGKKTLTEKYQSLLASGTGSSAAHPLISGIDAFLARIALIKLAEKTIDLQYYIWHRDATGTVLVSYLLDAADRGVQVRLLLDDLGSNIGDKRMRMLSQHPNISIRLFNPATDRKKRVLNLIWDFRRINRRMHNKSLTVDNTVCIVGGRNIGDEYFDAHSEFGFSDLDLMAVGDVVDQASKSFENFWQFNATFAIERLFKRKIAARKVNKFTKNIHIAAKERLSKEYIDRLKNSWYAQHQNNLDWYWGNATLVYDHPDKILSRHQSNHLNKNRTHKHPQQPALLSAQLTGIVSELRSEMIVISPYFVPGNQGIEFFKNLIEKNVRVIAITNSLAATDVSAVHAGYAKYRKNLLLAGVELYELRADAVKEDRETPGNDDNDKSKPKGRWRRVRFAISSSARASLHAKAFFFDRQTTFIGSLNLDPRSLFLNTEAGIVLENSELASMASDTLQNAVKTSAYRVTLNEHGKLVWNSLENGATRTYYSDPKSPLWRRMAVWLIGLFPIESQL